MRGLVSLIIIIMILFLASLTYVIYTHYKETELKRLFKEHLNKERIK